MVAAGAPELRSIASCFARAPLSVSTTNAALMAELRSASPCSPKSALLTTARLSLVGGCCPSSRLGMV